MTKMAAKWLKSIPYLWPKRLKNRTLSGRTYLYSPCTGAPPSPGIRCQRTTIQCTSFTDFSIGGLPTTRNLEIKLRVPWKKVAGSLWQNASYYLQHKISNLYLKFCWSDPPGSGYFALSVGPSFNTKYSVAQESIAQWEKLTDMTLIHVFGDSSIIIINIQSRQSHQSRQSLPRNLFFIKPPTKT